MIYKMVDLAKEAELSDPYWLVSREFGRKMLDVLKEKLAELPLNTNLVIDFENIRLLEWSFADEAFATLAVLLSKGEFPERYMVLKNLSETSVDNLEIAVTTRPKRDPGSIRNLVLVISEEKSARYLGKLESHLLQVWDYVKNHEEVTANDVAKNLNLEINTASTKLKTLYDNRLLKRIEQKTEFGKQYIYSKVLKFH